MVDPTTPLAEPDTASLQIPGTDEAPAEGGLARRAIARVRKAIITHELAPGSRVSETSLMQQFKLPRASVRVALSFFQQSGFIVSAGPRTQRVAPLSLAAIRETFQLRNLLEPAAAQYAIGKVDIARLRELNEACVWHPSAAGVDEGYRYLEANFRFHAEIVAATGMPQLQKWLGFIQESVLRVLWISLSADGRSHQWGGGHEEIIQALEERDAEKVARVSLAHLNAGQQLVYELVMDGKLPIGAPA
ncbi:MAG TPA: GntR family transcriptional regulator [Pseudorhodoferax sp.]|jgi:DNA-binding GntR family transcriptional regulator|nr:GntR family transcriptional regulator [Pseudorhodoferax sp.]